MRTDTSPMVSERGPSPAGSGDLARGVWRLADPTISLASLAAMFLGACAAAAVGPLSWGWLALTVLGILALETAKNASGEIFDYDSGTDQRVAAEDRTPFSGGKRVLVDGVLTRRQTAAVAALGYALGVGAGLVIGWLREPAVLWIGLIGVVAAYSYHGPPLRLSYRGLGELAVALCYGPLICAGTYLVQRGDVPSEVWWLSVPLGLLIAGFLWINEVPDAAADRISGKRTLVVRTGRRRAGVGFAALGAAAFGVLAALPALGLPVAVVAGGIAAVPYAVAAAILQRHWGQTARLVPAQVSTLVSFVVYALAAGGALLLVG